LGALTEFANHARDQVECAHGGRPLPDFRQIRVGPLKSLGDLRRPALVAGVNAGRTAEGMAALLDACYDACAQFRPHSGKGKSQGGTGPAEGKKPKRTKPPLHESNPLKFQVYQRIQKEHEAGKDRKAILSCLKADKDFTQQIHDAGLKLTKRLILQRYKRFGDRTCRESRAARLRCW